MVSGLLRRWLPAWLWGLQYRWALHHLGRTVPRARTTTALHPAAAPPSRACHPSHPGLPDPTRWPPPRWASPVLPYWRASRHSLDPLEPVASAGLPPAARYAPAAAVCPRM